MEQKNVGVVQKQQRNASVIAPLGPKISYAFWQVCVFQHPARVDRLQLRVASLLTCDGSALEGIHNFGVFSKMSSKDHVG